MITRRFRMIFGADKRDLTSADPVIPSSSSAAFWHDENLIEKICETGASQDSARRTCEKLGKAATEAVAAIAPQRGLHTDLPVTAEPFVSTGGVNRIKLRAGDVGE